MHSKHNDDRPLIHEAEGRDQDERTQLVAACIALLNQSNSRKVTDLHVLELVKWVHRLDRRKDGAQLSHYEIAKQLLLEVGTARKVLRRACEEMQLLLRVEQRYVSNGQQANRYEINWPMIRTVNRGYRPGVPMEQGGVPLEHPGVPMGQGGAPMGHPYKEHNGLSNGLSNGPSPPPTAEPVLASSRQEEEVRLDVGPPQTQDRLVLVRTERSRSAQALAVRSDPLVQAYYGANVFDAAELLGWLLPLVGREYLERLLGYWNANREHWQGAGALRTRLKRSRPDLAVDQGWPPRSPPLVKAPLRKSDDERRAEREAFIREREQASRLAQQESLGEIFRKRKLEDQ